MTSTNERIDWLTDNYDLSRRNALALILSEMGYSHSGIASKLDVTTSTARKYLSNLEEQIGEGVTETLPKDVRYPTFPGDTPKSEIDYSHDKIEPSPEFSERQRPINRGADISEIEPELIG